MRSRSTAVSLFLLALLASAPRFAIAAPRHELEIQAQFRGVSLDVALGGDYVFRDEAAWCAFWAQASGALIPSLSPPVPVCPAVDFHRQVVIASVGAGGGCNGFHIAAVDRVGSRRAVEVLVEHSYLIPGGGCGCTADFHVGAHAVVVARPIGDAEFVHESVGFECPLIPNP